MKSDFGYFEEEKLGKPYDLRLIRRLFPYVGPYKVMLLGSILLIICITLLDLSLPYVTKIAIDRYIVPQADTIKTRLTEGSQIKTRYLMADTSDPKIRTVVNKYRGLFTIIQTDARISYENLGSLAKEDIAVLRKDDFSGLGRLTVIFLIIILANFVINFLQKMIMEYAGHMIMHDLRMKLFVQIQKLSIEFFTKNPVGRLVTRATNDIQNMHELFTSVISIVFKDMFLLVGIAIVLIFMNWKLAIISFIVLPFVLYASIVFSKRAREVFRDLRIKIAEINTRFSETIGGIRVIQLFSCEKNNFIGFKKLNHENYLAGMRQIRVLAIFMPLIEILGVVAVAIVIFYGGKNVMTGGLSLGALVAFITYMKMFFRPIRDLAEKYNILQNAMASAERIFLLLDSQSKLPQVASDPIKSASDFTEITKISFENVSFCYVPGEPVLSDISFTVGKGETLAVVGPTGSGKTSLINLITRFYVPGSGKVCINDRDLGELDTSFLRSKTALVMQDPFLFSGTIGENILKGNKDLSDRDLENILQVSNCKDLVARLPNGLGTLLVSGGASISSGERQLISIARAFARDPQLILFDEATSYIDSQTEKKIQVALNNLMIKRTSIVVAHRLSTIRSADKIIVLSKGRIIETGTHRWLMDKKGFYFRLNQWQNQKMSPSVLP
ncbi:MAG: ABC transporter ATP-binding protein/permease [Deltaproteobacteria bacterium]|nr:ABC transporter ATP-binding protein/permease [Deltaproteobacteria bacterium]